MMLGKVCVGFVILAAFAEVGIAGGISDTQVSFQTTECNGDTGFASVDLEKIWRIKSAGCSSPDKPDQQLMQVLVKSTTGLVKYEVFTVAPTEADYIQAQIKAHMAAKRKALEGGDTVIIDH
jgi:hypothetical protein